MDFSNSFGINKDLRTPKYIQIVDAVIYKISKGNVKIDEQLPSINVFSREYKVSRSTVEKAYKILKDKNIIITEIGKGYYINTTKLITKIKVLFLINKLSPYKLKIYDSFIRQIGNDYHIDFEIYNCDESLFLNLLDKNKSRYNYYVIMPHFKYTYPNQSHLKQECIQSIESIPKEKLIIMDNNDLKIKGDIIEIYQDFENDIFEALTLGLNKIKKYKRLNLVITKEKSYPYLEKISFGFMKFCNEQFLDFKIVNKIKKDEIINQGDFFVVITDDDLVQILDLISLNNLILGEDVGLISYNETPFKRLLDIAVVSTDFVKMGETAADMIINGQKGKIKNPFTLIDRKSI